MSKNRELSTKLRISFLTAITLIPTVIPSLAAAKGWDNVNSPFRLGSNYVTQFHSLPGAGEIPLERRPWSETYWPMNRGGIAYRWQQFPWTNPKDVPANPAIFSIRSPSLNELRTMSDTEISRLSPAEKFDIVSGRFDYPITRRVLRNTGPNRAYWEGICDGWSAAALAHPEPSPVIVTTGSGIRVTFGSSDVKGLLAYYYATVNPRVFQLGKRCNVNLERNPSAAFNNADCEDINAGAFHIVLTNFLGLRQQGFVAEVDKGVEVWNNPVYGYTTRTTAERLPPLASSARGTVYRTEVETQMMIADDDENFGPTFAATVGTPNFRSETITYRYSLDMDAIGNIIGGDWISSEHPDYLWTKNPMAFTGDFQALNAIYRHYPRAR